MAACNQEVSGFLSLPREIRDRIYTELVVAEDPIQYDENFQSLSRSDTFAENAMRWMFEVASNAQTAHETRETFYQHNTFLIYTHDIPTLFNTKVHAMSFGAGDGVEPVIHSTPFEAGAWVRHLAVRVGWHTSGGWFTDACCAVPEEDLRLLLDCGSLRSVIIDARFGAWSYGYPQGIGWGLLQEMKMKWGKEFRVYNDQSFRMDTRRYTSDRDDISHVLLPRERRDLTLDEVESASGRNEHQETEQDEEAELSGDAEAAAEDEDEEGEEDRNEVDSEEEDGEEEDGEEEDREKEVEQNEEREAAYEPQSEEVGEEETESDEEAWSEEESAQEARSAGYKDQNPSTDW